MGQILPFHLTPVTFGRTLPLALVSELKKTEGSMRNFLASIKYLLKGMKDILVLDTLVAIAAISACLLITGKLTH